MLISQRRAFTGRIRSNPAWETVSRLAARWRDGRISLHPAQLRFAGMGGPDSNVWVRRYCNTQDQETAKWVFLLTLYGIGARIVALPSQPTGWELAAMTLQHVAMSGLAALVTFLVVWAVRNYPHRGDDLHCAVASYSLAPPLGFVVFAIMCVAHLVPAFLFDYVWQGFWLLIFVGLTSSLPAVSTFYYMRLCLLLSYAESSMPKPKLKDPQLEQILSMKRLFLTSLFWLLGFSVMGLALGLDKLPALLGQSGGPALTWFAVGLGLLAVSTFTLLVLRMCDEYEILRRYRIDEFQYLLYLSSRISGANVASSSAVSGPRTVFVSGGQQRRPSGRRTKFSRVAAASRRRRGA